MGEGHRVDGRSDIFSLGVVLYELMAMRPARNGQGQTFLHLVVARTRRALCVLILRRGGGLLCWHGRHASLLTALV